MKKLWHRFQHKMGWNSGFVVSRSDQKGRIFIGFRCSGCDKLMSEHDATNVIDWHLLKHKEQAK